jgi:DNA-binding MarR family transcriptional regulator
MPRRVSKTGPRDPQAAVDAIRRLVRGLRLAARRSITRTGVTPAQLYLLTCLEHDAAPSLSDLAQRTLTDRSSVATIVDRLAERKLITSTVDPDDRRRSVIRLTARGRALLRTAPESPTATLFDGLERLTDAELDGLTRGLTKLVGAMGLSGTPAETLFDDEETTSRRRAR